MGHMEHDAVNSIADPFVSLPEVPSGAAFAELEQRPAALGTQASMHAPAMPSMAAAPAIARLVGFDLLEQPVLGELSALPGERLAARSAVPLRLNLVGRQVVVLFENGDPRQPIIMGVLEPQPLADSAAQAAPTHIGVTVDGQRQLIEAEREIVLRCGDASITLTRAGKVIIKGNYILSRSAGYNKIKGAAIDIN